MVAKILANIFKILFWRDFTPKLSYFTPLIFWRYVPGSQMFWINSMQWFQFIHLLQEAGYIFKMFPTFWEWNYKSPNVFPYYCLVNTFEMSATLSIKYQEDKPECFYGVLTPSYHPAREPWYGSKVRIWDRGEAVLGILDRGPIPQLERLGNNLLIVLVGLRRDN